MILKSRLVLWCTVKNAFLPLGKALREKQVPRGVRKVNLCLFAGENELVCIRVAEDRPSSPDLFLRLGCEFAPFAFMASAAATSHRGLHKPGITIHSLDGSQSSI
jgi:hypothetical protein